MMIDVFKTLQDIKNFKEYYLLLQSIYMVADNRIERIAN